MLVISTEACLSDFRNVKMGSFIDCLACLMLSLFPCLHARHSVLVSDAGALDAVRGSVTCLTLNPQMHHRPLQ